MPTVKGREETRAFMARVPIALQTKVLRGAARAGATVIADEAKLLSISEEVAAAIKVATKREYDRIVAKIQVKGPGAYIAPWLEYGTAPHFISVDDERGMTAGRVNRLVKGGDDGLKATLLINGRPVGKTVYHPGTQPQPFLLPALDHKRDDAIAAAQQYINAGVARMHNGGPALEDGGEE